MFRHGASLIFGKLEHGIFVAIARIHEGFKLLEVVIVYVRGRAVRIIPLWIPLDLYTVKQQPDRKRTNRSENCTHDKTQEHVGTFL